MNISERLLLLPEHTRSFYRKRIERYNNIGIPLDLLFLSDIIKNNNECYRYHNYKSTKLSIHNYYFGIVRPLRFYQKSIFNDYENIDRYGFCFFTPDDYDHLIDKCHTTDNYVTCGLFEYDGYNDKFYTCSIFSKKKFTRLQLKLFHKFGE